MNKDKNKCMNCLDQYISKYDAYLEKLKAKGVPQVSEWTQACKHLSDERFIKVFQQLISNPDSTEITADDIRLVYHSLSVISGDDHENVEVEESDIRTSFLQMVSSDSNSLNGTLSFLLKNMTQIQRDLFSTYISQPIRRMVTFVKYNQPGFLSGLADDGKSLQFHLEPGEAFDCLRNLEDSECAFDLLRSLDATDEVKKSILRSFSEGDKESFCLTIRNEYVNLSPLKGICMAECVTRNIDVRNVDNGWSVIKKVKRLAKILLPKFLEKQEVGDDLNDFCEVADVFECLTNDNGRDFVDILKLYETKLDRLIFSFLADHVEFIKTLTIEEKNIFEEVLHRSEGRVFYQRFVKEYLSGNDSLDTKSAVNFSRFDHLFEKRQVDKNNSLFLGVNTPLFMRNGVWPDLMRFLYTNGYIQRPDIPLFVFRMSGVNVSNVPTGLNNKVIWRKNEAGLYLLCKEIYGSQMPATKVKDFFILDDPKKFRDDCGGAQEMKNMISSLRDMYAKEE